MTTRAVGSVFHHEQAPLAGQFPDLRHLAWKTAQMNRHDGPSPIGDSTSNRIRIDVPVVADVR